MPSDDWFDKAIERTVADHNFSCMCALCDLLTAKESRMGPMPKKLFRNAAIGVLLVGAVVGGFVVGVFFAIFK